MNNDTATPTPSLPEEPADKGLDGAACSPDEISDTPRTDAFCNDLQYDDDWSKWQMTASFAGQLERENAQLRGCLHRMLKFANTGDWGDGDCPTDEAEMLLANAKHTHPQTNED